MQVVSYRSANKLLTKLLFVPSCCDKSSSGMSCYHITCGKSVTINLVTICYKVDGTGNRLATSCCNNLKFNTVCFVTSCYELVVINLLCAYTISDLLRTDDIRLFASKYVHGLFMQLCYKDKQFTSLISCESSRNAVYILMSCVLSA